jgi:glycosyltransferase involved in cell wall biosynthesis
MRAERPAIDLSIIAPVYNERENLDPFVRELWELFEEGSLAYEVILVDDGSDDGSPEAIAELARNHRSVRGVYFKRNRGQSAAIDAGFKTARGRSIVTMDADLQNDPADIPALLSALDEYDAAIGYRRRRRDSWSRRLSSRIANRVRNLLSGEDIIDTGCSLKAFRRESLEGVKLYRGMHRFLPTLLRIEGRRVQQLPVNHRRRFRGKSKYGVRNRIFSSFLDLLAVRWMKKRRLGYEVVRHDP